MVKLVALYAPPHDPAEFSRHLETIHIPLLRAVPGLRALEVTRFSGSTMGDFRFTLMIELVFDSREALDAGMASREGKAVARDLMRFAAPLVSIYHGEVMHDGGGTPPTDPGAPLRPFTS